jgi:4-diphosphocytidyl-2-C-methyl-D-erythritol kinase
MYLKCILYSKKQGASMDGQVMRQARAKVNLTLDVLNRRSDGYHEVEMIMQQIDLFDDVHIRRTSGQGVVLTCSEPSLPIDEGNIAYRAAMHMIEHFGLNTGIHIHIEKRIPVAAGLAGGSTDAAAVISGINDLFGLGLSLEEQMMHGLALGADVPFCILGGCAIARGIGEKLTPTRGLENTWLLLVKPNFGVSTKAVYEALAIDAIAQHPDTEAMKRALLEWDLETIVENLVNVLEPVTMQMHSEIGDIQTLLYQHGALGVLMSGSGPTVFSIYDTYERAIEAYQRIQLHYPQSYVVRTYNSTV